MKRTVFAVLVASVLAWAGPVQAQTNIPLDNLGRVTTKSGISEDDTAANLDPGTVVLFKRCDTAASTASADGKYGSPCLDNLGRLWVVVGNGSAVDANSYALTTAAATVTATGAATPCVLLSAASTNSTSCKGSAGNFYGYELYNTTTTVYYLRLYNTAAAPTCSSATGFIRSIPIPPAAAAGGVGGAVSNQGVPVNYTTGLGYCITAGATSTDNTNAATGIFGEIRYK